MDCIWMNQCGCDTCHVCPDYTPMDGDTWDQQYYSGILNENQTEYQIICDTFRDH